MAKYGTKLYGSGVRYGVTSVVGVYYQSNIVALSSDYQTIKLSWSPIIPDPSDPTPTHWALVKSYTGTLDDPNKGTILIGGAYNSIGISYTDVIADYQDLEISYSIWLFNGSSWKFCGSTYTFLVSDKNSLVKISNWLPKAWLNQSSNIGEGLSYYGDNSFVTILGVFAFMYDYMRVEGNVLGNSLNPIYTPSALLQNKSTSLGFTYEAALGDIYNRSISSTGNIINSYKGTSLGLTTYTTALTHWGASYSLGHNLMLDYNDSSFEESIGRWGVSAGTLIKSTYTIESIIAPTPFIDSAYPAKNTGVGKVNTAGLSSVTMSLPASGLDIKTNGIPISANTRYLFSGWVRHDAGSAKTISATITWYDQFGKSLGTTAAGTSLTTSTTFSEFTTASDSGRNGKLSPLNSVFAQITITISTSISTNTFTLDSSVNGILDTSVLG
jgi:hypothetical protein